MVRLRGMFALVGLSAMAANPGYGLFIPAQQLITDQEAARQEKRGGYWADAFDRARLIALLRQPVGGLALSFDYRHGTQDLSNAFLSPFGRKLSRESETTLDTYGVRPELVISNWLSVYGVAALHDGSNRAPAEGGFPRLDLSLDGWAAGFGTTAAFGLPMWKPPGIAGVSIDPFFVLPDFNWTYNEFDDVVDGVDVINATTRVGFGARTKRVNAGFYGGPMYQWTTRDQVARVYVEELKRRIDVPVSSEPKDAWSGVVGGFLGIRISKDPDEQDRPTLLLTVEGGVGNRQGVQVSLRYEYDLLARIGGGAAAPAS